MTTPGCVLWFTGLSGAGKTTLARAVEARLRERGLQPALLDGDALRHTLNRDLGFNAADRSEHVRRVAEVARLMAEAGLIPLVALISPFRADRDAARARVAPGGFFEIHVDTPLAVCEARDAKGLYRRARQGELPEFTGIDSPFEAPLRPELRVDASTQTVEASADEVMTCLARHAWPATARR